MKNDDKNEGMYDMYQGGEGTTPVRWKVKVMTKKERNVIS